jgi:hypothetical protein
MSRRSLSFETPTTKTSVISSMEEGVLYNAVLAPEKISRTRPPGKNPPSRNLQLACCGLLVIAMCIIGGLGARAKPDHEPSKPPSKSIDIRVDTSTQLNLSSEIAGSKPEINHTESEAKEERAAESRPPFAPAHGKLIPRNASTGCMICAPSDASPQHDGRTRSLMKSTD